MSEDNAPLFIVDNSPGGRNGLQYLREWSELAKGVDIATGYFDIGPLLDLDGDWQRFDKIRILMGDEVATTTKKALLEAVRQRAVTSLNTSLEAEKDDHPFLDGADAVVEALVSGKIECRVYNRDKFHAKAYITHGRLDVVGSQALVGSSNFTRPGLTQNVELNIKLESGSEVAQLQAWYEQHWDDAEEITEDILRTIRNHTREFAPFEVYARSLQALVARTEPSAAAWDEGSSHMYKLLDRYQQEAYRALTDIAERHGGAFLCDGVGLGKTYVGLMLIERLIRHERKRVVLFAPKAVKDAVWANDLKEHLPDIGGVDGGSDFSSLAVFSNTDLSRKGDFPERLRRVTEMAHVVIIDEAHNFRNRGRAGDPDDPDTRSRYRRLFELIGGGEERKTVYMLTATPINNSLYDFSHLVELFTQDDDRYFSSLGVNSVRAQMRSITKNLQDEIGEDATVGEHSDRAEQLLASAPLFRNLVVQRSRAYAKASQIQEGGSAAIFPDREPPKVAEYSIRKSYAKLLDLVEQAFQRSQPLFSLAMYFPLAYPADGLGDIDRSKENRQKQVVGLIRTNFLKRFESSVYAFEVSCDRLLRKLLAFLEKNVETDAERNLLDRWNRRHAELLNYAQERQLAFWDEAPDEDEQEDDIVPAELIEKAEKLDREEYNVPAIIAETYSDLDEIATLLDESRKFEAKDDDKLGELVKLLKSKELDGRKVLIFTEFADTARYLKANLEEQGIDGLAQIDSCTKTDRAVVVRRFSPYYNRSSPTELAESGDQEIRVLISTDVLSEGLNLQDASRVINYDIHWNPVRLMQRIGRVDRRLNPKIEELIRAEHPELAADRGTVAFWNFLPPEELETLLKLYTTVSRKTLKISKTFGIEGQQLLTPDDDWEALKEFNAGYEGSESEDEKLHLVYQRLTNEDPDLEARLTELPSGIFSGLKQADQGEAVFFCYELPGRDADLGEYTMEAGETRWYLRLRADGRILEDPGAIAAWINCAPEANRVVEMDRQTLLDARQEVRKHIRNTYMKDRGVPQNAPPGVLVGWLEVNRG